MTKFASIAYASDASRDVLNTDVFAQFLTDRHPDSARRLLMILKRELSQRRADFTAALQLEDEGEIRRIAHAVYGSTSVIGAAQAAAICRHIEMFPSHGEEFDWLSCAKFQVAISAAINAIENVLASRNPASVR